MPRTPCCCGPCPTCKPNHNKVLHGSMSASNNVCNGTPGCNSFNDFVLSGGEPSFGDWTYVPDVLPLDGTPICRWAFNSTFTCGTTANCDACSCYVYYDMQANECDPGDGSTCTTQGQAVVESGECSDCGTEGCTPQCDGPLGAGGCNCVSDGTSSTGYRCICDDSCECNPSCADGEAEVHVFRYLSEDETEIVTYVVVRILAEIATGYTTQAAVDGKAVCDTATITLTSQNPGAQVYCTMPASIDLEFV